jgi:hypothetical protein
MTHERCSRGVQCDGWWLVVRVQQSRTHTHTHTHKLHAAHFRAQLTSTHTPNSHSPVLSSSVTMSSSDTPSSSRKSAASSKNASPGEGIRQTFDKKSQPALTVDTLTAANVDGSFNAILENGHCPMQFRTQAYVYAIDNKPAKRVMVLQSLLTDERIVAVQDLLEVNDNSIQQNHHVEIIGFLKSSVTKNLEFLEEEDDKKMEPEADAPTPYLWALHTRRVGNPMQGELFLREALMSARRLEQHETADGLRARDAAPKRRHELHPPRILALTHAVELSKDVKRRMFMPAVVGDVNTSDRMVSVHSPFGLPLSPGSLLYTIDFVHMEKALRRRTPKTGSYEARELVISETEHVPLPSKGDFCVVGGSMADATTFHADLLVRYPAPIDAKTAPSNWFGSRVTLGQNSLRELPRLC